MQFNNLLRTLSNSASVADLKFAKTDVCAISTPAVPFVLGALQSSIGKKNIVVVVATRRQATELFDDLVSIVGDNKVRLFPSWETLPLERVSPATDTMGKRLRVLNELNSGSAENLIIVAPIRAIVQIISGSSLEVGGFHLETGASLTMESLITWLLGSGYRREYQVEHRGEFGVRGSIVDVFPSDGELPIRIDFFGDEIDRLIAFDPSDQLTIETVTGVDIYPARELLLSHKIREKAGELQHQLPFGEDTWRKIAEGQEFDGMESWLPWLDEDALTLGNFLDQNTRVILIDPPRLRSRAKELIQEELSIAASLGVTWEVPEEHEKFPGLFVELESVLGIASSEMQFVSTMPSSGNQLQVEAKGIDFANKNPEAISREISALKNKGFRILICGVNEANAKRMQDMLRGYELDSRYLDDASELDFESPKHKSPISLISCQLEHGAIFTEAKIAIIGQGDVSNRRRSHRAPRTKSPSRTQLFDALAVGGYVVHNHHGVGRFAGMVKRNLGGVDRDYLLVEYRGDDKLYVPTDQMESISPYLGGEIPSLSKLGGSDWQKTRSRIRQNVNRVAQELVVLYQKRITTPGFAFSPDTVWQKEMEDLFPFELTPDQEKAILEVKSDMETDRPMDRLVCGDVGFGKTEVALRAAFKAVQDGKQAAVLVPTTLLAQQHYQTFSDRFANFPMRVEVISRFLTPGQSRAVLSGISDGSVDVVIGTHKLLGQGVKFADLGLLVVDEEQHFGVTHKEAIKSIKSGVDVLTLTATPIPRTLEMSLTGIRDMSLLNTPPTKRQPILTYVGEYDERAVSEAFRRELLREGQVFFVHNRVSDIEQVARRLAQLVPEARFAVAHGQMDEGTLEQTVFDFWEGRYDVLVCTTIIESGIDMPTVNTLVVDRADRLGLGQLHQLRGRVGRSGTRGYAYLFHPIDVALSENAYERLKTIGENTDLGSGFRIAMRDLEIRGAGNILGDDQSGHIAAVGYDLYVKMVEEAVKELKGETEEPLPEIKIEIPVGAVLPDDYISRTDIRLEAYRRLSQASKVEDVDVIEMEWTDRFGPVPVPAKSLLRLAKIRVRAISSGLNEITVTGLGRSSIVSPSVRFSPLELRASTTMRIKRLYPKAIYKDADRVLVLPLTRGASPVEFIENIFDQIIES